MGLFCFVILDFVRDLVNDIMILMLYIKFYIRKKVVLIMYKVFLKYFELLCFVFFWLKEKLEDFDFGV